MVLLKPVIKVATRPVAYLPAEFSADRCGIRIMAICRDPVRRHTGHRLGGSKARLGSGQVTVLAQYDIDQCAVTINRAIQISPLPANPDVRLIDVPAGTDSALAFAAQVLHQSRRKLRFPLSHRLVGEDEPAGQEHLCQISQAQLVTKSPEHHEGDHIARILRLVQGTGTALVELLAAPAAEPAVALRRPLGRSRTDLEPHAGQRISLHSPGTVIGCKKYQLAQLLTEPLCRPLGVAPAVYMVAATPGVHFLPLPPKRWNLEPTTS